MKALTLGALLIASFGFAEAGNMLKPTNKEDSWQFVQAEGGKGSLKADGDSMVFTVTDVDGTTWHVQAAQVDLDLIDGKEYVLKFQIKASEPRNVGVFTLIDQDDWHNVGLSETISVEKEFKSQEFTFTADKVLPKKNRLNLDLGESKGTVTVKDMILTAK
jgi:carbohydrate binding protein with CBM4/9 domain